MSSEQTVRELNQCPNHRHCGLIQQTQQNKGLALIASPDRSERLITKAIVAPIAAIVMIMGNARTGAIEHDLPALWRVPLILSARRATPRPFFDARRCVVFETAEA